MAFANREAFESNFIIKYSNTSIALLMTDIILQILVA